MKKHQQYAIYMVIGILLTFGAFLIFVSVSNGLDQVESTVIDEINLNDIDDGYYEGESNTSPVYVDLTVYVLNHRIEEITINYKNVFIKDLDLDLLIQQIYIEQSVKFDYASFDAYTSIAFFSAVSNAL